MNQERQSVIVKNVTQNQCLCRRLPGWEQWGSVTDAAIKATMVLEDAGETNARFQPYRVRDCEDGRRPDGRHQPPFRECRRHLWHQESHPGGAEVGGGAGEGVAPPGQGAPQLLGGRGGDIVGRVTQHRPRESHQ